MTKRMVVGDKAKLQSNSDKVIIFFRMKYHNEKEKVNHCSIITFTILLSMISCLKTDISSMVIMKTKAYNKNIIK